MGWSFILILFLFNTHLANAQGSERDINSYDLKCQSRLKISDFRKSVKESFSGILFGQLFEPNGKLKKNDILEDKTVYAIQKFSDDLLGDAASILFSSKEGRTLVIISDDISPRVNCRLRQLKITPKFLQQLLITSCSASIRSNLKFFHPNVHIRNTQDYFFYMRKSKKRIRNRIKNEAVNENILAYELVRINSFIDYEIRKAIAFIYGHETYHFLTNCAKGEEEEFNADGLGSLVYKFLNQVEYDINRLRYDFIPKEISTKYDEIPRTKQIHLITGRSIMEIVRDIYIHTDYEKGSVHHPNLDTRINLIGELIMNTTPDELYYRFIDQKILTNYENY